MYPIYKEGKFSQLKLKVNARFMCWYNGPGIKISQRKL